MTIKQNSVLDKYPDFRVDIGVEIHVQLKTQSKIFCSCPNHFGDKPNENVCPICAGYPGVLPVLNERVVNFAIMAGIATNCEVAEICSFARKHYMYPDLPKNFQITQDNDPICTNGYVPIVLENGEEKKIRLTRIHIEEDAGKSIHVSENESYIDLNRAGTPLLEIVSEPDLSSTQEAKSYLNLLRSIVQYLGISDANMEEGSFRGDVNISVRRKDESKLGTKVELKNINSFKFICQAIEYEIDRQITEIKEGNIIFQETRSWDSKLQKSFVMRSKEEAEDYKYLKEPDLPLVVIDEEWLNIIKKSIPELPHQKLHRFIKDYGLSLYDAQILTSDLAIANFFEKTNELCNSPKKVCNWITRDLLAYLKDNKLYLKESGISHRNFAELITELEKGTINSKVAQDVFIEMVRFDKSPLKIIEEKNLKQIGSSEELEKIVLDIIKENPDEVKKYLSGKDRLFSFFVGQAMKKTKGKGNPKIIQELLKKYLK